MILYQLKCTEGHQFEAWFKDAATYDVQADAGEIMCPYCGGNHVSKAPMAPRLAKGVSEPKPAALPEPVPAAPRAPTRPAEPGSVEARAAEVAEYIFQAAEKLRRHVEENCDFVGDSFADEARKIHYGESDERGIYGTATDEEAAELDEEGIEFQQLRWFSRRND
jgi:hypothetical protein